eukprot:9502353-Pyramimonas_sp.AAC.1
MRTTSRLHRPARGSQCTYEPPLGCTAPLEGASALQCEVGSPRHRVRANWGFARGKFVFEATEGAPKCIKVHS